MAPRRRALGFGSEARKHGNCRIKAPLSLSLSLSLSPSLSRTHALRAAAAGRYAKLIRFLICDCAHAEPP